MNSKHVHVNGAVKPSHVLLLLCAAFAMVVIAVMLSGCGHVTEQTTCNGLPGEQTMNGIVFVEKTTGETVGGLPNQTTWEEDPWLYQADAGAGAE